jgi:hypothetical protein
MKKFTLPPGSLCFASETEIAPLIALLYVSLVLLLFAIMQVLVNKRVDREMTGRALISPAVPGQPAMSECSPPAFLRASSFRPPSPSPLLPIPQALWCKKSA